VVKNALRAIQQSSLTGITRHYRPAYIIAHARLAGTLSHPPQQHPVSHSLGDRLIV